MNVNDAVIQDTKTVAIVNGQYTVLQPGNVYFNEGNLTNVGANSSDKTISIVQKRVGPVNTYDFSGLDPSVVDEMGSLDQDLYIVGDVINETGAVTIKNFEGSITVSGQITGNPINIYVQDQIVNRNRVRATGLPKPFCPRHPQRPRQFSLGI